MSEESGFGEMGEMGESLDEWWARSVGASAEWIENYANAYLPFGTLYEQGRVSLKAIRESSRLWKYSQWNLLMTETGAVLYTQFVICCRKIIRSQGSAACWYKTLSSRAFIKRGPSRSHAVSSEGDLFPISIYVHEKNDAVDKPDTPDAEDILDTDNRFRCKKIHFTFADKDSSSKLSESELFADTMLTLIFMDPDTSRIPDDCPFPVPIIDKIAYAARTPRNVLLRNGKLSNQKYYYPLFTRDMRLDTIATHFFINTEAVSEFIGRMQSLPPKKRRTGVLFLLRQRENMYNRERDQIVCPYGKSAVSTLFLVKTWMTILLSHHLDRCESTCAAFSSLMHDALHLDIPESPDTLLVEFIVRNYFSGEECAENPLKAMVDDSPALMNQIAVAHLTSVLCSDILAWPPYRSSHDLLRQCVYNANNVWSFACNMMYEEENFMYIEKRGSSYYGEWFSAILRKETESTPVRCFSLFGCSYAQSVVLLDAVEHVLRDVIHGWILFFPDMTTYTNTKKGQHDHDVNQEVYGHKDDGPMDIQHPEGGEDSSEFEEAYIEDVGTSSKIEHRESFLFYIQPVPQTNGCSALVVRANDRIDEMSSYFGTAGYCSASISSEDEVAEEGEEGGAVGITHPMEHLFASPEPKQSRSDPNEYLFNRYMHTIRLTSLWIGQCWSRHYSKKKKYYVPYQAPLYAILGQSLSMCYSDMECLLAHNQEGYAQGYLTDMVSAEAAIVYKIVLGFTRGFRSEMDTAPEIVSKDVHAGTMFMYSVPALCKWCRRNKGRVSTSEMVRAIERFTRSLNMACGRTPDAFPDAPIVIEEDFKAFKKYKVKDCAQVLVNTHKRVRKKTPSAKKRRKCKETHRYKPLCATTLRITENLGIRSITIAQSGPSSFVATNPESGPDTPATPTDTNRSDDSSVNMISESTQRTRFFFDDTSWALFVEHCIKVIWPSDKNVFETIVSELVEHLYPFHDFAMEKLLHRQRKTSSSHGSECPFNEEMLSMLSPDGDSVPKADNEMDAFLIIVFVLELCQSARGQAEAFLEFVLNEDDAGMNMSTKNMYMAYHEVFHNTAKQRYDFHIPVEAPVIQRESKSRKDASMYCYNASYFDQTICIPERLPSRGWQHFREACPSSLVPDALYLFGRNTWNARGIWNAGTCSEEPVRWIQ